MRLMLGEDGTCGDSAGQHNKAARQTGRRQADRRDPWVLVSKSGLASLRWRAVSCSCPGAGMAREWLQRHPSQQLACFRWPPSSQGSLPSPWPRELQRQSDPIIRGRPWVRGDWSLGAEGHRGGWLGAVNYSPCCGHTEEPGRQVGLGGALHFLSALGPCCSTPEKRPAQQVHVLKG